MKEFVAELQNKYSNEHVVLANFSYLNNLKKGWLLIRCIPAKNTDVN
jgi:hypothetical protein